MNHNTYLPILLCVAAAAACCANPARPHGGRFTPERLQNVLNNCAKHEWAARERDKATSNARIWAAKSDEELWTLIPGQELPRTIDVTWDYNFPDKPRLGCLNCGDRIFNHGNYPYEPDIWKAPWKLKCPGCGEVFPKNDFGKYYRSGIDEHGVFNPSKADRSLLFNEEHPDADDPLHKFGVDDGYGYIDKDGRAHKFIGYYAWKLWNQISSGLAGLAEAYVYTGDKLYARKAAILLDRIADVYADMDWAKYAEMGWYHSDGGSRRGKIQGRIWETGTLTNMAISYDKILFGTNDNPELFEFLKQKGSKFKTPRPKGTRDLFVENVDAGILRTGVAASKDGQIMGNEGMRQHAMTACAIALDTEPETTQWLDWVFSPDGGKLPQIIVGSLDRDGTGDEAAPNYSLLWIDKILAIGEHLDQYPKYKRYNLFRDFPQLRQSFTAGRRMSVLGVQTPNIGDSGSTGKTGRMQCDPKFIAKGFRYYRDPEIARAAYEENNNSAEGLLRDIFSAEPDALAADMEKAAKSLPPRATGSLNMTGFGLAKLELSRGNDGKALWCYYGRNGGHGHLDQLNMSIFEFGVDLTPDLGYPEFATAAWPSRRGWHANTLSHNLVVVDKTPQTVAWDGDPRFFTQVDGLGAFEIDASEAYPQTKEYSRTMIHVPTDNGNAYVLDIFRVRGGNDHVLGFHGPPGEVIAEGIALEKPTTGTYAGKDIAFAQTGDDIPRGYSYLYNVARSNKPGAKFSFDWKAQAGYHRVTEKDDIHLRMHMLTDCHDVALADGDPPQNKPGNPRRIRYALMHRAGENLDSTFVSVIEPYRNSPIIKSVELLSVEPLENRGRAVRVELADGSTDWLLNTPRGGEIKAGPGIKLAGRVGFLRQRDDKITSAVLIYGSKLEYKNAALAAKPAFTGTVVEMEKDPQKPATVLARGDLETTRSLVGQQIIFANDRKRNACYTIHSIVKEGEAYRISCGPISFVKGFRDAGDYSKGYIYDFDEGTTFVIPNSATFGRK